MIPLRDSLGKRGFVPVMGLWIIVWIGVYVWQYRLPIVELVAFQREYGLLPGRCAEWWGRVQAADWGERVPLFSMWFVKGVLPLFTYHFLHSGFVHLLGNIIFFRVFGARLENRAGWLRFLLFYLSCAAVAGAVQVYFTDRPRVPTVGSSGAIAGSMAAYMLFYWKSRVLLLIPVVVIPVFVEVAAPVLVIAWMALQFPAVQQLLALGTGEPVGWYARLGAVIAGVVLAPFLLWPKKGRESARVRTRPVKKPAKKAAKKPAKKPAKQRV